MNRLAYQLIVDKKVKRQIKIISILYSLDYPIPIEKLSELVGASERTVSNDLHHLREIIPPEVELFILPKIGVKLIYSPTFIISDFIQDFAEDNPVFEILENLFNGVVESLEDYAARLFISESTLRQKLLTLKKKLKEYNVKLTLTPIALVGNEVNIRCFFFSYYRNATNKSFMIPEQDHISVHEKVINNLKEKAEGSLYTDYRRALHWLIITEQRIKSGHFVQLSTELINSQKNKQSFIRFKKIYLSQLVDALQITNLSDDEVVFAYLIRLDSIVYRNINTSKFVMMYEAEIPTAILDSFLNELFTKFNLNMHQDKEILKLLKSFLTNSYLLSQLSTMVQKNSYELNHKIQKLHPATYKICLELLKNSNLKNVITIQFFDDFAVSLTLLIVANTHSMRLAQKKVLFSLSGETTYLNYFIMICNCFLPKSIDVVFSFNEQITNEYLTANKINFWIHNYYLKEPLPNITSFQISSFPTQTEWSTLISQLIDIPSETLQDFFDFNSQVNIYD